MGILSVHVKVHALGTHFTSGTTCEWARFGESSSAAVGRRTAGPQRLEGSLARRYPLERSGHSHGPLSTSSDNSHRHLHS